MSIPKFLQTHDESSGRETRYAVAIIRSQTRPAVADRNKEKYTYNNITMSRISSKTATAVSNRSNRKGAQNTSQKGDGDGMRGRETTVKEEEKLNITTRMWVRNTAMVMFVAKQTMISSFKFRSVQYVERAAMEMNGNVLTRKL